MSLISDLMLLNTPTVIYQQPITSKEYREIMVMIRVLEKMQNDMYNKPDSRVITVGQNINKRLEYLYSVLDKAPEKIHPFNLGQKMTVVVFVIIYLWLV